jgi:predicted TPR repeat methyltransferase
MRIGAVIAALGAAGATSVIDLGCGEGRLLKALFEHRSFERIAGMDVSWRALEMAEKRLRFERLPLRSIEAGRWSCTDTRRSPSRNG